MTLTESELEQLIDRATAWAGADPDPQTTAQLRELVANVRNEDAAQPQARHELADAFDGTLQFGTAGLRAPLGAGPNRMNRVVVRRAAAGIAGFLQEEADGKYIPRAVIGFDARHNSDIFARDTAAVFAAAGIETFLLPAALPTPVLAYAVRALDCEAGVMVTASHNPPQDNGYKVYLGGRAVPEAGCGAQIVAPYDAAIAAKIDDAAQSGQVPLAENGWTTLGPDVEEDYVRAIASLALRDRFPARDLKIVLTPLHGVGGRTAGKVLASAGFNTVTLVPDQAEPDPNFPTVAFPNPEEPGALDLALETAAATGADIVLANDPDADRAAVAAVDPDTGEWRMLRGDEVGALLGAHMVARMTHEDGTIEPGVLANSVVSSRLLRQVAETAGLEHRETLTGFKWISRVPGLSYGYEEALGYCVAPQLVRDKDGISAALLIAELAAELKAAGRTIFDSLDELALYFGLHVSDQLSVRVGNLGLLGAMMNRLREHPPESFGGSAVDTAVDLAEGSDALPATDSLLYTTRDGSRVIVRPSGTEPKLKCYLEVLVPVSSTAELPGARALAREALDAVLEDVREALGL